MMMNSGLQQQVLHRPKAELAFRPWWDSVEDTMLAAMLAIGNTKLQSFEDVAPRCCKWDGIGWMGWVSLGGGTYSGHHACCYACNW